MRSVYPAQDEGVMDVVRETANGLGDLVGLHLKMAQRELTRELHALSGHVASLGILAALLLVGYGLAMAGGALLISGLASVARPFLLIGGGHVVLAGAGLGWMRRSRTSRRPLAVTTDQARKSLTALTHAR